MLLPLVGGIIVVSCETNRARLPALQLNHLRSKSVRLRSSTINKTNPAHDQLYLLPPYK